MEDDGSIYGAQREKFIAAKETAYDTELVLKGMPLTWRQMDGGLPPTDLAASADKAALAAASSARFLREKASTAAACYGSSGAATF